MTSSKGGKRLLSLGASAVMIPQILPSHCMKALEKIARSLCGSQPLLLGCTASVALTS